ncbi:hypothetical protein [Pseudomonas aeruginosa]|uniref:hypothetical protein n=1 Tax=Pseudomonas aeruginosa TaxID=287 RepID=UPI0038967EFC
MSIELNKESVEQADASSCQGTNCGTTTGDHSSECLAEAAAGQGWELKPGDLCGRDCPIHKISVEQAGGDERAKFEYWASDEGIYPKAVERSGNCYKLAQTQSYWMAWQARAALAQPSPKCSTCGGTGMVDDGEIDCYSDGTPFENGPVKCVKDCPACKAQPSPAQAKQAEQPEVVARVDGTDEDWFIQPEDETELHNEGLLFAGCELGRMIDFDRIVGALRAENAKLSEALDECDGDRWKLRSERDAANARLHEVATACATAEQERDAALARVAELEQKSAGSWTVDTSCGRPILMYEGCSVIEDQTAYEVIRMIKWIGELERQEPVATIAKVPGEDWNGLHFYRDLQGMQPGTKLYAAPVAQAQHSVPEGWMLMPVEPLLNMMSDKDHDTRITAERQLLSILAAAPGKEVGHE